MGVSCKGCMAVVDLNNAPVRTSTHGPRGDLTGYSQRDIRCPRCGALLQREINGVLVTASGRDPREKPEPVSAPADEPADEPTGDPADA